MSMNLYVVAGNGFRLRALATDDERLFDVCFNSAARTADDAPEFPVADLHKSWHLLREVLGRAKTDRGDPGAFIFEGGTAVGVDGGYGRPRLFTPEAVVSMWSLLAPIDDDQLDELFDLDALREEAMIYGIPLDEPRDELLAELGMYLSRLRDVLSNAANAGDSVLVVMS